MNNLAISQGRTIQQAVETVAEIERAVKGHFLRTEPDKMTSFAQFQSRVDNVVRIYCAAQLSETVSTLGPT